MTLAPRLTHSVAAVSFGIVFTFPSLAAGTNTTGLPTYPRLSGETMDASNRSIPNGQHCIHFETDTPDALADVEAWYKKRIPGAKADDVDRDLQVQRRAHG
jgi:hypothetical protein